MRAGRTMTSCSGTKTFSHSVSLLASASNDTVWENVFVPEQDVMVRPARILDSFLHLLISWFTPSVCACYLGIAQAARDYAVNWARERTQVPFVQPMSHY